MYHIILKNSNIIVKNINIWKKQVIILKYQNNYKFNLEIIYLHNIKELTHKIKLLIEILSVKRKFMSILNIQNIGDILILI